MKDTTIWYKQSFVIILFLLFFFPVGVYLMWKYANWHILAKLGVSTVATLIIIFIFYFGAINSNTTQVSSAVTPTPTQQQVTGIDQFPVLKDFVSGENNDNKPKLKNFEYIPETAALNLDINLDQAMSDPAKSIELEMSDAYMAVYNQNNTPTVTTMTVTGWLLEIDRYGNSKYVEAVGTRLNKEDADMVNWQTDKATLELQILPGLWKTFFAAPSLHWTVN